MKKLLHKSGTDLLNSITVCAESKNTYSIRAVEATPSPKLEGDSDIAGLVTAFGSLGFSLSMQHIQQMQENGEIKDGGYMGGVMQSTAQSSQPIQGKDSEIDLISNAIGNTTVSLLRLAEMTACATIVNDIQHQWVSFATAIRTLPDHPYYQRLDKVALAVNAHCTDIMLKAAYMGLPITLQSFEINTAADPDRKGQLHDIFEELRGTLLGSIPSHERIVMTAGIIVDTSEEAMDEAVSAEFLAHTNYNRGNRLDSTGTCEHGADLDQFERKMDVWLERNSPKRNAQAKDSNVTSIFTNAEEPTGRKH